MVNQLFFRSAIRKRQLERVADARLCPMHLPFGQDDELVENPCLPFVVGTVTATVVTVPTGLSPFEPSQLVAQEAHTLRVTVVVRLTNRLTDLTFEPRVELTVDFPLCVAVTTGGRLLPTFRDADDLIAILPLIEVRATQVVRRPRRPVHRPSRVIDRTMRLHTRVNRPNQPWTTLSSDHDGRMPIPTPPILRIRLSHSAQRQNENPKVK